MEADLRSLVRFPRVIEQSQFGLILIGIPVAQGVRRVGVVVAVKED